MDPIVEIRGLQVHYRTHRGDVRAVDDVSLKLQPGEAVGLVGESGCGKSTLGKAILGILPPGTWIGGEILYRIPSKDREEMERLEQEVSSNLENQVASESAPLDSRGISSLKKKLRGRHQAEMDQKLDELRKLKLRYDLTSFSDEDMRRLRGDQLVLIYQDPMSRLDPLMTVQDHFVEIIKSHKQVRTEEAADSASRALISVGVPPSRLSNYPHEFSGGMRQRIMIAMALVMNPDILIADEPTTSLDVLVEAQILNLMEDLKKRLGMTLFLITHNLGVIAETCDRVAVMYAGKIVEVADINELFKNPKHPYSQGLLSSVIHLETKELSSIEGQPPDLVHPPTGCRFHPRCPFVMDICKEKEPPMVDAEGSQTACFLYGGTDE